ncbi:MAG: zinc dependent phospholipase C family protein [Agathobacter sp.]|nr:zinc dependent phospholipase C family protein [Agathobacter sp.]
MAQRTIHYLFGELFAEQIVFKDKNRFLLGSILPDAYADKSERDITHYKRRIEPNQKYFDFDEFRKLYFEQMQQDDLYLGYYMHLVQDAFYRQFLFSNHFKVPNSNREEIAILHNDYHILNSYIVEKYNIQNNLKKPVGFEQEQICKLATFRIDDFLEDMAKDFTEKTIGETLFLTEAMLDEFIDRYTELGLKELQSISSGKSVLHAIDFAWSR